MCGKVSSLRCEADDNQSTEKAAACQKSLASVDAKPVSLGSISDTLDIADGVITLTYVGGKSCSHTGSNRKTVITFTCPDGDEAEGPMFLAEDGDCGYIFEWKTQLACSTKQVDCQITVNGKMYDFSPLSRSDVSGLFLCHLAVSFAFLFFSLLLFFCCGKKKEGRRRNEKL